MVRPGRLKLLFGILLAAALVVVVACGGDEEEATQAPVATKAPAATTAPEATKAPVATATSKPAAPTSTPEPVATGPSGTLTAAIVNVYYMNSSPRYCPACSVTARTGTVETLLEAVRDDSGQITIGPLLATDWEQSPDGTSWTKFTLRDDVEFHQGYGKMTAKDVAFSWNDPNPTIEPDSIHDTGGDLANILINVDVIDDQTVQFNWKVFNGATMLQYVTNFIEGIGIFSKDFFDEVGADAMKETLIGTGPFEMAEWTQHKGAFVTAVEDHWRKVPFVEKVDILEVTEATVRKAMLETGEAQISEVDLKDWPDLFEDGYSKAPESFWGDTSYTAAGNYWQTSSSSGDNAEFTSDQPGDLLYKPVLDTDKPWIGDPADADSMERSKKVRHALAMAIDRDALLSAITQGLGRPAYAPGWDVNHPLYKSEWEIPYDPEAAVALLEEAGYADGFEIEWWSGPNAELHEAIGAMWLKELNVVSTFDRQNYSSFRPSLVNRTNTKIFFSGGNAHLPPTWPQDLSATALSRPGGYCRGIEIPKFEETYLAMSKELDETKLGEMVQSMYDWNSEWMVWTTVYQVPNAVLYDPKQIESWKMVPEGKGVLGKMNSLEWVKLAD